ncbi:MAG: GGDEF domain-containing protein [Acidobacteriota bacterium]
MFGKKPPSDGRVIFRDWKVKTVQTDGDWPQVSRSPEQATLTLADFLRQFGKYAFDLEDVTSESTREKCLTWARHILKGGPPPGAANARQPGATEWKSVRLFVTQHRRHEHRFVTHSLSGLRQVIWTFVQGVSKAFVEDRQTDDQVFSHLTRLKKAVRNDSVDALKTEVLETVTCISGALQQRKERQRDQMRQLGNQLRTMRHELVEARQKMALDPLTKLYNRKAFDDQLGRTADLSLFSGQPACLLMLDIDHFKQVNDNYGHQAGDTVLREVANCCINSFPRKTDFVARYGGEEFAIILGDEPQKVGSRLADQLLNRIRQETVPHEESELAVTASVGLAEIAIGENAASWLKRADTALYEAKDQGRDRVVVSAGA